MLYPQGVRLTLDVRKHFPMIRSTKLLNSLSKEFMDAPPQVI